MHRFLTILVLICTFSFVSAQDTKHFLFSRLTSRSGLVSDNVFSIQQDTRGYIWTLNGNTIQRYDGHRWLTFRHEPGNPKSLPEGPLYQIVIDTKNRMWVMYKGFSAGMFNLETFTFQPVKINATKESLHKAGGGVIAGSNGDVLLVARHRFIFGYNERTNSFDTTASPFKAPPGWLPITLIEDRNSKNYWLGTEQGLVKYNAQTKKLSYAGNNTDKDPYIEAFTGLPTTLHIYLDSKKRMWVVSWPENGMRFLSFDPAAKKVTEWQNLIGNSINGMYFSLNGISETHDGKVWIHGQNILAKLRDNSTMFDVVPNNEAREYSIRFDYIHYFFQDREHNIWLGTNTGLYRFNPSSQLISTVKNKRVYNDIDYEQDVTDVLQTREGDILVATWGAGIFSYDAQFRPKKVDHFYEAHTKMEEGMSWALHQTKNGDIWRTQQGGYIFIWHADTKRTEKLKPPVFEGRTIRQISEDKNGNLWFGTQGGLIVKWDPRTKQFTLQQRLESIIPRILIDSSDYLWACTEANGLFRINTQNGQIVNRYMASDTAGKGLRSSSITDIIQYNDSTFVVLAEGLNFLNIKNNTFKYFTTENGLPTTSITNIVKDRQGYIWMSSEAGIHSFHPWKRKLSTYTADDGVTSTGFNTASSAMLNDGSIVFGTSHDVLIFAPEEVTIPSYTVPKVEITGITLANKRLNADSVKALQTIELAHHQNSVTIDFSTLTYQNSYGLYYVMEGLEKDWILDAGQDQATYNYLPPGHYTFKVACRDENGKLGEITELHFYIKPPFWKTWWFYSFLVLTIITVLLLFDKQRLQRMQHEQGVRASIANNLHEEVNTVLQNISVLSEIARIKADTEPGQSKEYIYEIQQKSRNMVVAMSDVLWSINPSNDTMQKTIDRIHEVAQALQNKHSAAVTIQTDKKVYDLNLAMALRHEFILIYKLAMVTLIEDLKAPETTVQLDYDRGKLYMQIFALHLQLPKHNNVVTRNLNEIRARVGNIPGADIDIQSDEKGTWFNFEVKV